MPEQSPVIGPGRNHPERVQAFGVSAHGWALRPVDGRIAAERLTTAPPRMTACHGAPHHGSPAGNSLAWQASGRAGPDPAPAPTGVLLAPP